MKQAKLLKSKSTSNSNSKFDEKTKLEEKLEIENFSYVKSPSKIIYLSDIQSIEDLKDKIVYFQKINFGDYEDYKLCCKGEMEEFSNYFFLEQQNTRFIKKTFDQIPMYIKGKVINVKVITGGIRYHLQQGTKIIVLKLKPL